MPLLTINICVLGLVLLLDVKNLLARNNLLGLLKQDSTLKCALNAIKDKSCPYIKARYESLKRRRGHKKAIIAIARFLLTCAFHILNDKVPFDSDRFDILLNKKIKKHNKSIKNAEDMISYLTKLGYTVTI